MNHVTVTMVIVINIGTASAHTATDDINAV